LKRDYFINVNLQATITFLKLFTLTFEIAESLEPYEIEGSSQLPKEGFDEWITAKLQVPRQSTLHELRSESWWVESLKIDEYGCEYVGLVETG
jgi:hypothetical protein